ncbi:MAG TPA: sulfate/molybdate ABC transporter ATP-binding protein [Syntrophomonadaceae bacterium]|nr:sulfate/molybdate ABC transporter ATP-binding protein [Syntrophomonadaceae bacterium]
MELAVHIKKKLPGFLLNVDFETGSDVLGLLGPSGAGKSMTLRCIAGIEKPDSGRIILNDQVLFDSEKGVNLPCRKRKIGFLFQNYALFPNMTVEENIAFGLDHLGKNERNQTVAQMVEMIKLKDLEKRYPCQLSGGQQQRVALARALAVEPQALLLDEPFSALDDYLRSHMVKQLLETLSNYTGVTLFVAHNMEEVYRICSNVVVLSDGGVEATGTRETIFSSPPSLIAAQLTGCKNFSAVRLVKPNELEAVDWGVTLKVNTELKKEIRHVGIRAHFIGPVINKAREDEHENVFHCWPSFTSESPFRMTIYLALERIPTGPNDYDLQWEITKDLWDEIKKQPPPWSVCLNPDKLIMVDK